MYTCMAVLLLVGSVSANSKLVPELQEDTAIVKATQKGLGRTLA